MLSSAQCRDVISVTCDAATNAMVMAACIRSSHRHLSYSKVLVKMLFYSHRKAVNAKSAPVLPNWYCEYLAQLTVADQPKELTSYL